MTDLLDKDGEKGENGQKRRVGAKKAYFGAWGEKGEARSDRSRYPTQSGMDLDCVDRGSWHDRLSPFGPIRSSMLL